MGLPPYFPLPHPIQWKDHKEAQTHANTFMRWGAALVIKKCWQKYIKRKAIWQQLDQWNQERETQGKLANLESKHLLKRWFAEWLYGSAIFYPLILAITVTNTKQLSLVWHVDKTKSACEYWSHSSSHCIQNPWLYLQI